MSRKLIDALVAAVFFFSALNIVTDDNAATAVRVAVSGNQQ